MLLLLVYLLSWVGPARTTSHYTPLPLDHTVSPQAARRSATRNAPTKETGLTVWVRNVKLYSPHRRYDIKLHQEDGSTGTAITIYRKERSGLVPIHTKGFDLEAELLRAGVLYDRKDGIYFLYATQRTHYGTAAYWAIDRHNLVPKFTVNFNSRDDQLSSGLLVEVIMAKYLLGFERIHAISASTGIKGDTVYIRRWKFDKRTGAFKHGKWHRDTTK